MTVIGAHVLALDLGVCWADSEVYDVTTNRPSGWSNKVYANPAGFAFVMAGWAGVARQGGAIVMDAPDMATALRRLPWTLRRSSERLADAGHYPHLFARQHAALIGFDPAGGMLAYRLIPLECFVPMLDDRQTVPQPTGGQVIPAGPMQVQAIARRQMERIREDVPDAAGGALHVAIIRPGSVAIERVCNLAEHRPAAAPSARRSPPECSSTDIWACAAP